MTQAISRFSRHALERAREMGLTIDQLQRTLINPDFTRRGESIHGSEDVTYVSLRDNLAIPVTPNGTIKTILWYRTSGDERFDRG